MSQEKESEDEIGEDAGQTDPSTKDSFDLKNHARGILMLVVVCGLLWILSKFGPGGADWLGNQTKALFGLEPAVESIDPPKDKPGQTKPIEKPEPNPDSKTGPIDGDPRIANARKTIVETLGGPDQVIVQHIAISGDEKTMVAAVELTNPDGTTRLEEIFFEQDDFERYISTKDSPVPTVIKIWKQE